jgi:hypothetical protein
MKMILLKSHRNTNNVRLTHGGAATVARRRHGLEVEDEGLLKDLVVIFIF